MSSAVSGVRFGDASGGDSVALSSVDADDSQRNDDELSSLGLYDEAAPLYQRLKELDRSLLRTCVYFLSQVNLRLYASSG